MTTLDDMTTTAAPPGRTAIRTTEVDGVPVLWCEAPGPLRAHLTVRAGWADETLPTRGWNHLVEHLALTSVGRPGDHSNGHTDATTTSYHVEGSAEEVVDFLTEVTGRLADLPVTRLADEVGVLRAEQDRRGGSVYDQLLGWRYGARDYGLGSYDELGLSVIPDAEALRQHARSQAGRHNAVLWLSGPPPADLRLHLSDGAHLPPPDPYRCVAGELPAWTVGPDHTVAALAVVRRGWQAPALRHVLQARLVESLRVRLAVAYSPSVDYSPLTADAGWLSLHSDLVGGRQSEGVGPFLRLLEELAGDEDAPGAVTEADVEEFRAAVRRRADDPYAWAAELHSAANHRLLRRAESGTDATEVTVEQVREAAREAAGSLLATVPRGLGTYRGAWSEAVASVVERVDGVEHLGYGTDEVLVGSVDGVSRLRSGGVWTVRRDSVAGVLRWPDGRRVLVGEDGVQVPVEPTMVEGGADLVRHVDRTFPAHVVVAMSARAPGVVPVPATSVPGPVAEAPGLGQLGGFARSHRWLALAAMLVGFAALVVLLGVLLAEAGGPVGVTGAVAAGGGIALVRHWRATYPAPPRRR